MATRADEVEANGRRGLCARSGPRHREKSGQHATREHGQRDARTRAEKLRHQMSPCKLEGWRVTHPTAILVGSNGSSRERHPRPRSLKRRYSTVNHITLRANPRLLAIKKQVSGQDSPRCMDTLTHRKDKVPAGLRAPADARVHACATRARAPQPAPCATPLLHSMRDPDRVRPDVAQHLPNLRPIRPGCAG